MRSRVEALPGGTVPTQDRSRPIRVLIHGMNYTPELIGVGRYTGDLAEHLAGRGHHVEVVTAPPHYPGWCVRPPYFSWRYRAEVLRGVRVIRCPILLHASGRGIWRLLAPLSFAVAAAPVVFWRILRTRPNVVIVVQPSLLCAPAVLLAAALVGARRVLHVQDLEIDLGFAVGHLNGRRIARLAFRAERFMLRRFDRVVAISERMRARLVAKGVAPSATRVVRNWVDLSAIRPIEGPNEFRYALGIADDEFVVLYAGQIGAKQGLDTVLDAVERLAGVPRLTFVIAGEGPLKPTLQARYGVRGNIRFLPLQPEEKLNALLNLADLHVLPQAAGTADLVLPSKLGGMLASGRPVLAVAASGTELHDLLCGSALLVPPGHSDALAHAIAQQSAAPRTVRRPPDVVRLFDRRQSLAALEAAITGRAAPQPARAAPGTFRPAWF